jgi:hypothetical protein
VSQITLRGMEPELEVEVRRLAARKGISLNKAALQLIRKGAGLPESGSVRGIGDGLDDWVGNMTSEDANAISEATTVLDRLSMDDK